MYPLALEGALKLKEISYIHAEGYASGELKHGPIALVDETVPVIVMAPRDALFDKTVSNMQEVMARGGKVLLITDAAGAARGRRRRVAGGGDAAGRRSSSRRSSTRCRRSFWPTTPPSPRAPTSTSRATSPSPSRWSSRGAGARPGAAAGRERGLPPMPPRAILFGSLGVLAETAELQRRAFNAAFAEAGLDWQWEVEDYVPLLALSGETRRIDAFAAARDETVDTGALCARTRAIFRTMLQGVRLALRPGVDDAMAAARRAEVPLALISRSEPETVEAVLAALDLPRRTFAVVADPPHTADSPASSAYVAALGALRLSPAACLAVADTPEAAEAAAAAGVPCIAFPGALHVGRRFGDVAAQVHVLAPRTLGLSNAEDEPGTG